MLPPQRVGSGAAARGRAAGLVALLAALLLGCATPPAPPPAASDGALQPERAGAITPRAAQRFEREAVVAAHPLAAEAGARMLREGGSAVDAAIAAQLVLGLVEPQSSGLGGGGFLMHWDGRRVQAYDGRETAPAAVGETLFLDRDGVPLDYVGAVVGGRAVGVPGLLRMLDLAHGEHGRLPWAQLFEPAIALAEQGFPVGERLHGLLRDDVALPLDPDARAYFYDADGRPWPVGHLLRNPEYAALLRELARSGAARFYEGRLGRFMVATAGSHPRNPGRIELADLAGYRALEREPLCHDWRRWRLCGMPPPSSGAIFVGQLLGILDQLPPAPGWTGGVPDAGFVHRYTLAARLAHADRERFVGDPERVAAPTGRWDRLLDADYLATRAALVGPRPLPITPHGDPEGRGEPPVAPAPSPARPSTTHLSIVDAAGRAVALTSSLDAQFGAHVMVNRGLGLTGGFLLNNQLTDFSFSPRDATGRRSVNRVEPGKRPRSSMAPTLVFERRPDGSLRLDAVLGSPGGIVIPQYVAKTVWALYAEGLDAQTAVALPHFAAFDGPTLLETGADTALERALVGRGHAVRRLALTSGLHLLRRDGSGWQVGVDPRREGAAAGR